MPLSGSYTVFSPACCSQARRRSHVKTRYMAGLRRLAVQGYGTSGETSEDCHRRGLEQAKKGDFAGAAASHADAVRLDPSHAAAHEERGMALLEIKRYATARRSLAAAMRLGGPTPGLCMARGRAVSGLNRHREAVRWYRRAAKMDPALVEAYAEAARGLEAMGMVDKAKRECDRAIKACPSSPAACLMKAGILVRYELDGGASELYDRAIALDPSSAEAHAGRSRMLWRGGGDDEGALASIREAIRLRPDSAELRRIEGRMLAALGRGGEVSEHLGRVREIYAGDPETLCDMAEALEKDGRPDEALAAYGEAAAVSDNGIAHLLRGELHAKMGRHREAVADFDESLRRGEGSIDVHLYKGNSLRALGDALGAARSYKGALRMFPESADLCEGMAAALGDLGREEGAAKYRARAKARAARTASMIEGFKGMLQGEEKKEMGAVVRDWTFDRPWK